MDKQQKKTIQRTGCIRKIPPKNSDQLTPQALFKLLCEAGGGWKYKSISLMIYEVTGIDSATEEAVKSWASNGKRHRTPGPENKEALYKVIREYCADGVSSQAWISALADSWGRTETDIESLNSASNTKTYEALLIQSTLTDSRLINLPAPFETDQSLPLATAYVDLRLAPASPIAATHSLLEPHLTLTQRLNKRLEERYAVRRSPKDLLDMSPRQSALILGPPGAGKSSLLRRIALDIAEGKWSSAKFPLFVEARVYWRHRRDNASVDILTFAIHDIFAGHNLDESTIELIKKQANQAKTQYILLIDGLDEIAADPTAVSIIYSELNRLARTLPWIVTTRPAGLMAPLGETLRCEMIELDEESIESLIDNWCASISDTPQPQNAEVLKIEIFGSPSTREMARNPFLLTALCFLKYTTPNDALPKSRIAIYESLLERIAFQAQRRLGDQKILSPRVLSAVQDFVLDLYARKEGPIQIFNQYHWYEFTKHDATNAAIDFEQHIVPARLLSQWGETDRHYHFLHLTLQEHLIARAMLNQSVQEALQRRFSPAWRAVFRFYGSLLWQQGRRDEFRSLTQTLYEEQDVNGLSFLALADIFADAGIRDTTDWIKNDLRDSLYYGAIVGHEAGPDAMIDALAALDPEWLEKTVYKELEERKHLYETDSESDQQFHPSESFIAIGHDPDSPYEKLARTRTGSAKRTIVETFWGENQNTALMSAHAFASIATPSDRRQIVQRATEIPIFDDMAARILAFAQASQRPEFLPFLTKVIEHFSEHADGVFPDAINLVAIIGTDESAQILEKQLVKEAQRLSSEFDAFEVTLDAVTSMDGNKATKILERILTLPEVHDWRTTIESKRFEADPTDTASILEALSDDAQCSEVISALSGAANNGRLPHVDIVRALRKHIDVNSVTDVFDFVLIESTRLHAGEPPILCDLLFENAKHLYAQTQDPDDENALDHLTSQLQYIFDTLGQARWKPAGTLVKTILFNQNSSYDILGATIDLAGHVFSDSPDTSILERLKELLFEEHSFHCARATLAIGRIDLEELFRLQSADNARDALEKIAADQGFLIFDRFWADKHGTCTEWVNPPKKILFAYDDESLEIPQIFTHELSRFGFFSDSDNPDECVAYLIFNPTEDFAKTLAEKSQRLNQQKGNNNPLFTIPAVMDEDQARVMAITIGQGLASQYDKLTPHSLEHV